MQCPFCGARDTKVLDSRPAEHRIRRRRECIFCGKRFTTYEMVERPLLMVKKRDGSFEPFDRQKLIDAVAYIRFASVYEDFTDVASFVAAISALDEETAAAKMAESKEQGE